MPEDSAGGPKVPNKAALTVTYFRSSGPGGQKKNKTETAVRVRHEPTGIVVTATESRFRSVNLKVAMERLQQRLEAKLRRRRPRVATAPGKAARERRLKEKKVRSAVKKGRGPIQD